MHSEDISLGLSRARELMERNYSTVLNVSKTPILDFFYPIIVGTFWGDDVATMDYIALMVAEKFSSMKNIPHTRREFTSYVHEHRLNPQDYGDLALLNVGIIYRYNEFRRKGLDVEYFRDVGQEQYDKASGAWVTVYKRLANEFMHFETGLRIVSDKHIYSKPKELLLDQLIDAGVAARRSPTEENLLRLDRIRGL